MQNTPLDEPHTTQENPARYSELSYTNAIVNLSIFVLLVLGNLGRMYPALFGFFRVPIWLGLVFFLAVISGLVLTTLSFVKKEPANKRKHTAAAINILMFMVQIYFLWLTLSIFDRHF